MSTIAPKPIIANVLRTWKVTPGMTFALVEDIERCLWIVESCPVGTHCWTLAQAAELSKGTRTRPVLMEAIAEANRLLQERFAQKVAAQAPAAESLGSRQAALPEAVRPLRRAARTAKTAVGV